MTTESFSFMNLIRLGFGCDIMAGKLSFKSGIVTSLPVAIAEIGPWTGRLAAEPPTTELASLQLCSSLEVMYIH